MTNEQHFFIKCLADHLHLAQTEKSQSLDWNVIKTYAAQQQVEGIIGYQCRSIHDSNVNEIDVAASSYFFANRAHILKKVKDAFAERKVQFILFKGAVINKYYPIPSLRTMGDIDLLVHGDDKNTAEEILIGLGFETIEKGNETWVYRLNQTVLELHHDLIYSSDYMPENYKDFAYMVWNTAYTEDNIEFHIEPELHFAYLILHIRKHILANGIGFRQFMDLAVMIQSAKIKMEKAHNYLEFMKIDNFANVCISLCCRWFNLSRCTNIKEENFELLTQSIFRNGVFGFSNEKNRNISSVNKISTEHFYVNKIKHCLEYLFPKYGQLITSDKYAFLKNRPFLLPIAWMYRVGDALKNDRVAVRHHDFVNRLRLTPNDVTERQTYLKMWELS